MVTLVRKFVGRFGLPLVILSLFWLTWQFLGRAQGAGLAQCGTVRRRQHGDPVRARSGEIAMPVSWLPLVADFRAMAAAAARRSPEPAGLRHRNICAIHSACWW